MPTKVELVKLSKHYFYLVIVSIVVFLMTKPPSPANIGLDHNLIEAAKLSVQSVIVNQTIKQIGMLFLLLYTVFIVIESLIMIRDCVIGLYNKRKHNNVTE